MANGKKSVLLYCDLIHTVAPLSDEEAGRLFKHFLEYVNDLNPEPIDRLTQLLFEPIKQNLKRDLKKWEETKEVRSKAGKASAEARRNKLEQTQTNSTNVNFVQQTSTNSTVNVNDNVNVTVNDNVKSIVSLEERKLKFAQTLEPFLNIYGKEMLNAFYLYWTEPNKFHSKLRFESEKFWDLNRRLVTWKNKEKSSAKKESSPSRRSTNESFDNVKERILNGQLEIKPII